MKILLNNLKNFHHQIDPQPNSSAVNSHLKTALHTHANFQKIELLLLLLLLLLDGFKECLFKNTFSEFPSRSEENCLYYML